MSTGFLVADGDRTGVVVTLRLLERLAMMGRNEGVITRGMAMSPALRAHLEAVTGIATTMPDRWPASWLAQTRPTITVVLDPARIPVSYRSALVDEARRPGQLMVFVQHGVRARSTAVAPPSTVDPILGPRSPTIDEGQVVNERVGDVTVALAPSLTPSSTPSSARSMPKIDVGPRSWSSRIDHWLAHSARAPSRQAPFVHTW